MMGQRRLRTRAPKTTAAAPRKAEAIRAESSIVSRQESGRLRNRAMMLLAAGGDKSGLLDEAAEPTCSVTISSLGDAMAYIVRLRWLTIWFPPRLRCGPREPGVLRSARREERP
jgi:hypothetical protein